MTLIGVALRRGPAARFLLVAIAALRAARRHLDRKGVLLFDVWHGPAVLARRPAELCL